MQAKGKGRGDGPSVQPAICRPSIRPTRTRRLSLGFLAGSFLMREKRHHINIIIINAAKIINTGGRVTQ